MVERTHNVSVLTMVVALLADVLHTTCECGVAKKKHASPHVKKQMWLAKRKNGKSKT
jgi:hypothetical protein